MKKLYFTSLALLLILLLGSTTQPAQAQNILRGPYLQSPGPHSIIVRWRTDSLTDSRVYYGDTIGAMTLHADSATPTTEHRVLLTGLNPLSRYYYGIGSSTQLLRGNDSSLYFTTPPDSNTHVPVRFWVIGDFGHGNQGEADVRDAYIRFAAKTKPADLQLWLGDNAYADGTDAEFQNKVFDTVYGYGKLFPHLPFASTSGNHDYNSICPWQDSNGLPVLCNQDPHTHTGPYLNLIDPPTNGELGGVPSHLKLFYSMDYGDVHLVSLNSELGSYNPNYNWVGVLNTSQSFTSPMLDWLKQDLQSSTKKWKIIIWHQTPYSGQDNFTEENSVQIFCTATRHHFNPILEQYGADVVLAGHDHNYQRSYLINGHYGGKSSFTPANMINGSSGKDSLGEAYIKYTNGPLAEKGTVYVVEGNSSSGNDYSPISHPAIYYGQACNTCLGSFILDINGDRLDGYYLTATDSILDQFTIKKETWTGIADNGSTADDFAIYPNPTAGAATVAYTLAAPCAIRIVLLDITGRLVQTVYSGIRGAGRYQDRITLDADKANGAYIIRLQAGSKTSYRKLVKL